MEEEAHIISVLLLEGSQDGLGVRVHLFSFKKKKEKKEKKEKGRKGKGRKQRFARRFFLKKLFENEEVLT
jgi:hypothetical protein